MLIARDSAPTKSGAPSRQLVGKTAIVTGSTSGIGLGIAHSLAAAGADIVLNGLGVVDETELTRAMLEADYNVRATYSNSDMSKPEDVIRMVREAEAKFGAVDIVVNNAGIQHVEAIETFPPDTWDKIIAINLTSAFHTIRAAIPGMKQRGWGRIINVASAHALVASPFKSAYVASKHAILGLTKTVALEVAEFGITVNAVCPGYVLTPLVEKQIPETAKARNLTREQVVKDVLLHAQPTHEFVTTDQVGALTLFLCTSSARSITGTALAIDGGWTAQ